MRMIRRVAREMVLQSLFQMDFIETTPEELAAEKEKAAVSPEEAQRLMLEEALKVAAEVQEDEIGGEEPRKAWNYAHTVLFGAVEHLAEIDALIGKYAINWDVKRMPGIDRNILRMAIYEMRFAAEKIPVTVGVNEAVELAKAFGSDASARFVNGVLGKLMREEK